MARAKYRSQLRQQQAGATRQAILDAARGLFVERGYAKTTVADIAAAANVAVPTVYTSVGSKSVILEELRRLIPIQADVPSDFRAAIETMDAEAMIAAFAAGVRRLIETSGALMFAIESAAPFEPVAAEAWQEGIDIHRAGWGIAVERIEALGALKDSLPATKAADIAGLLSLPAVWRTLARDCGWTNDEIESWIVQSTISLITDRGERAGR